MSEKDENQEIKEKNETSLNNEKSNKSNDNKDSFENEFEKDDIIFDSFDFNINPFNNNENEKIIRKIMNQMN